VYVWRVPLWVTIDGREIINATVDHKGDFTVLIRRLQHHWVEIRMADSLACSFGALMSEEVWIRVNFWSGRYSPNDLTKNEGKQQFQYDIANSAIPEF
jgi:hypothetical protein